MPCAFDALVFSFTVNCVDRNVLKEYHEEKGHDKLRHSKELLFLFEESVYKASYEIL